jgi:PilZ domain-containing protein
MRALTERERRLGLHLSFDVSGKDASGTPFTQTARTLNISGGGLLFETARHLLVGSRLVLHIQIPPALRKHFGHRPLYRVRAVVCRVERFQHEAMSRVGVRFLGEIRD